MSKTEKITINMSVVDLGKVDLLVDQGFYSNRTDFIRTAIRKQLDQHDDEIKDAVTRKSLCIGITYYSKEDLEEKLLSNKQLEIKMVGMLILSKDITPELACKTIKSIKVLGSLSMSKEVRDALVDRIK